MRTLSSPRGSYRRPDSPSWLTVICSLHLAVALLQDSTTKTGGAGAPTLLSNLVTKVRMQLDTVWPQRLTYVE